MSNVAQQCMCMCVCSCTLFPLLLNFGIFSTNFRIMKITRFYTFGKRDWDMIIVNKCIYAYLIIWVTAKMAKFTQLILITLNAFGQENTIYIIWTYCVHYDSIPVDCCHLHVNFNLMKPYQRILLIFFCDAFHAAECRQKRVSAAIKICNV